MTPQQIPVLAGALVANQGALETLSNEEGQWVIKNTKKAIELFINEIKKDKLRKMSPASVDEILIIEDPNVQENNILEKIFSGGIDNINLIRMLKKRSKQTGKIVPTVYDLFDGFYFSASDWDEFFSWNQIEMFCEKYPKFFSFNYRTIFLLEKDLVACVVRCANGLKIYFQNFEEINPCFGKYDYRLVAPQPLTL